MLSPFFGDPFMAGAGGMTPYDPYAARRSDLSWPTTTWPSDITEWPLTAGGMGGMGLTPQLRSFNRNISPILSADLIDKGNEYEIHCDLPGVNKEDIEVNITEDFVNIRGIRKQVYETDTDLTHRIERTFGKVERSLRLPKNADSTKVSAKFEGGVLLINFLKIPGMEGGIKKITIA